MKTKEIKWVERPYSYEGMVGGVTMFSFNWRSTGKSSQAPDKPWELYSKLPGQQSRYFCKDKETCETQAASLLQRFAAVILESPAP